MKRSPKKSSKETKKVSLGLKIINHILFWGVNASFLIYSFFINIFLLIGLGSEGDISFGQIAPLLIPQVVAIASVVGGIVLINRKQSHHLIKLLFVLELPLMFLGIFKIMTGTLPVAFSILLWSIVVVGLAYGVKLFEFPKKLFNHKHFQPVKEISTYLGTLISGWAFLLWFPFAVGVLRNLFSEMEGGALFFILINIPFLILGALYFLGPLIVFWIFVSETANFVSKQKLLKVGATFGAFLVVLLGIHWGQQYGIQQVAKTFGEVKTESTSKEYHLEYATPKVKKQLQRAYLARFNYLLSEDSVSNVESVFEDLYECEEKSKFCRILAVAYQKLLFPITYNGKIDEVSTLARENYKQLFDANIQEDLLEKIQKLQRDSVVDELEIPWQMGPEATILSKDKELVHLEKVETQIDVHDEYGLYTNLTTYTFQNTTSMLQEVFIEFSLPSAEAVITDLRLGMDLQYPSQVAPRGAAKAVYERSMRRSIDPALLEQVGTDTYRLRVFPIPRNFEMSEFMTDQRFASDGKQKVQVEFTAFVDGKNKVSLHTPLKTRNLKIDKDTVVEKLVYNQDGEELVTKKTDGKGLLETDEKSYALKDVSQGLDFSNGENNIMLFREKISWEDHAVRVYLDNSKSADRENQLTFYQDFISYLNKQPTKSLQVLTYNFETKPIKDTSELNFWGWTDSGALVEDILERTEEEFIFILTDNSRFESKEEESKNLSYGNLYNKKIFLVQSGGVEVNPQKNELSNAISATNGKSFQLSEESLTKDIREKIVPEITLISRWDAWEKGVEYNRIYPFVKEPKWREALEDLWAFAEGKKKLVAIANQTFWESVAQEQTQIARRAHIVNQFNSLIALENEQQQEWLDEASKSKDKYKSDYDTGEVDDVVVFGESTSEAIWIYWVVLIVLLLGTQKTFSRCKRDLD